MDRVLDMNFRSVQNVSLFAPQLKHEPTAIRKIQLTQNFLIEFMKISRDSRVRTHRLSYQCPIVRLISDTQLLGFGQKKNRFIG